MAGKPQSQIKRPEWAVVIAHIVGEKPGLLMDAYREAETAGSKKDTDEAIEAALHKLEPAENGHEFGIPAAAFQGAMIEAGRWANKKGGMTWIRGVVRVLPNRPDNMIPLESGGYQVFRRAVSLSKGKGKVIKSSPVFPDWSCDLPVSYRADELTKEDLATLLIIAGESVGVGGFAPRSNCGGPFGRFRVRSMTPVQKREED